MKSYVSLSLLLNFLSYSCINGIVTAFHNPLHRQSSSTTSSFNRLYKASWAKSRLPRTLAATTSKTSSSSTTTAPLVASFPWTNLFGTRNNNNNNNNSKSSSSSSYLALVQSYIQALNDQDMDALLSLLADDNDNKNGFVLEDYAFSEPIRGKPAMERHLRLQWSSVSFGLQHSPDSPDSPSSNKRRRVIAIDNQVVDENASFGILFHYENDNNNSNDKPVRGMAVFEITTPTTTTTSPNNTIQRITWCTESSVKSGPVSLNLLTAASNVMDVLGMTSSSSSSTIGTMKQIDNDTLLSSVTANTKSVPELYFEAWNQQRNNIQWAVDQYFTDNVQYDDTAFPQPIKGKEQLIAHLITCAKALPPTFTFQVDKAIVQENNHNNFGQVVLQWHVENDKQDIMPFTRGISFYTIEVDRQKKTKKIQSGIDFVEPGPIKPGQGDLLASWVSNALQEEPLRWIPLTMWFAYMYIVFFSDGILPGANALALETRTWEEVRDLSLNFFLVAPLLHLPLSPTVHPMLEGVFNLLLSWAAMFAGFLSDDRKDKPNLPALSMLPMVIGMQFLTSAFLLPYLALRSSEQRDNVTRNDLSNTSVYESKWLGPILGTVGTGSIVWAILGRYNEFGDWTQRWSTFLDLLSIDRVGSSFLVDLAIFALFQGWLVDDDMKRRGVVDTSNVLIAKIGKYVPFFGMVAYLALRPSLRTVKDQE